MSPSAPAHADDVVLDRGERLTVFILWLVLSGAPSLGFWVLTGDFGDFGYFYSPFVWLLVLGFSQPFMARVLGQVGAVAALPAPQPPSHLHPELARMAHEAAAIRDELALHGLDVALERAWILTCEFTNLPAEQRAGLDRSLAALTTIRALLDLRADGRRVPDAVHSDRLARALTDFEASLVEPGRVGFR